MSSKAARYATVILLLVGGGTLLGPHTTDAKTQKALASVRFIKRGLTVAAPRKPAKRAKVKQKLFQAYRLQTKAGQKASISFADRSVLHMNQRTDLTLRSPSVTYLTGGEADVIDAPGVHHTIRTATATVAAIGTQYDVRVAGSDGNVRVIVTVVDGTVRVSTNKGTQTVNPGQQVTVASNGTISTPNPVPTQSATGWTQDLPKPSFVSEVSVRSVTLFKARDAATSSSGGCAAPGEQATTSFLSTDPVIEAKLVFGQWKGRHTLGRQFVDPTGRVADAVDSSLSDVGSGYQSCMWVANGGWPGLSIPGTWTLRLLVDAVVVKSVTYKMTKTSESVITPIGSIAVFREPTTAPQNGGSCDLPGEIRSSAVSPNDYAILVKFHFSVWQGTHSIHAAWMAPDGSTFFTVDSGGTDQGYGEWCDWLDIKGTPAATMPGTWTVQISADGSPVFNTTFTISASAVEKSIRAARGSGARDPQR